MAIDYLAWVISAGNRRNWSAKKMAGESWRLIIAADPLRSGARPPPGFFFGGAAGGNVAYTLSSTAKLSKPTRMYRKYTMDSGSMGSSLEFRMILQHGMT